MELGNCTLTVAALGQRSVGEPKFKREQHRIKLTFVPTDFLVETVISGIKVIVLTLCAVSKSLCIGSI